MMKKFRMVMSALMMALALQTASSCSTSSGGEFNSHLSYTKNDLTPKPFNSIEVDVVSDVYYTQNDSDVCNVRLDYSAIDDPDLVAQLKEKVRVIYRDGEVEIGVDGKLTGVNKMNGNKRLKIHITSPDLIGVKMEGLGSFHAKSINTDRIEVANEGVGSITIEKLLANKASVSNEGVGSVRLQDAQVDYLDLDNEGVGSVRVDNYKGKTVTIDNEGVGSVKAQVDCQKVVAKNDGVGSIKLKGVTRSLTKTKDGIGSINVKELKLEK